MDDVCEERETNAEACGYSDEEDDFVCDAPQLFTQSELNDLVRDLDLPKQFAELFGSRLKGKNLLAHGSLFSWHRNRENDFE
ncbi:hypothetical protein PR048_024815 [Dryococelus australis]|uniref:Uncharacterized protein n=1 Tax=Dryococelus australis TaxID=614101 RepID=A0ABQ9GPL8_9NEOP|nr:hypothetical protein PR048_024815 [Dryococelus australis]